MNTASVAARTDWANVDQVAKESDDKSPTKKKRGYASSTDNESSDDDEDGEYADATARILESNASLFETSSSLLPLPPTLLNVVRQRDGNLSDPNKSVVNVVQFHPSSGLDDSTDGGGPLLMTAGMDKMLRFFRVDGEENPKIHGIHCK